MNFASIFSYASYPEVYVEGSEFCVIQRHGGIRNTVGGGANVINGRKLLIEKPIGNGDNTA